MTNQSEIRSAEGGKRLHIDHIAIAVQDIESALEMFTNVLGFQLVRRLEIKGKKTGMMSAELAYHDLKFVLCQGTEPESQVSRLIANSGPGVAHIAIGVDDVHATAASLAAKGMKFDTGVIEGPGLTQIFSSRCANSGLSFEFISRSDEEGFLASNVLQLFEQLEASGSY